MTSDNNQQPMLSDDRLHQLLRDAHDLESFERPLAARSISGRPVVASRRPLKWFMAAAAALAVYAAVQITMNAVAPASNPGQSALKPHPKANGSAPAKPDNASLLLAVYQNDAGNLSCVNWSADALKGRAVSSLPAEELTRLALSLSCDPQAARILVVGLEGPATALPSSDDRAKAVAQCLSTTPPCGPGEFNARTCASAGCLDSAVKVRIESLALK